MNLEDRINYLKELNVIMDQPEFSLIKTDK